MLTAAIDFACLPGALIVAAVIVIAAAMLIAEFRTAREHIDQDIRRMTKEEN